MKYITLFLVFVGFVLTSCGSISSTTYIDADKSFLLGENQHRGYKATVKNTRDVPVEILVINNKGVSTSLGELKKGESIHQRIPASTDLQIQNNGNDEARVKIKARGGTNLSMGYNK